MNKPLKKHILLGLDISLTETGYYKEWPSGSTFGVIKTTSKMDMDERIWIIANGIYGLIQGCKLVCIEGLAFAAKGNATKDLAGVNRIARFLCYNAGVHYMVVTPSQLKSYVDVKGKGPALKKAVKEQVKDIWGEEFRNHNVAEAFIACQMAKHVVTKKSATTWQASLLSPWSVRREIRRRKETRSRLASLAKISMKQDGGTAVLQASTMSTTLSGQIFPVHAFS